MSEGNNKCPGTSIPCSTFDNNGNGLANFYVQTNQDFTGDKIDIEFEIDLKSINDIMNLLPDPSNPQSNMLKVQLDVRNNSNVTLDDVLKGEAVFVNDCTGTGDQETCGPAGVTDPSIIDDPQKDRQKKLDFVQELFNQVVTRMRSFRDANDYPITNSYQLIDEYGLFNQATSTALQQFKYNFQLIGKNSDGQQIGNYTANFSVGSSGTVSYNESADDTTDTFRKLMKDYNYRTSIDTAKPWLHKIVDKATLVGAKERIPADGEPVTADNADTKVNVGPNNRNDTGLYELYKNVVEKFVSRMIDESERYAGMRGITAGVDAPSDNWVSRTSEGPGQHGQYIGMSYSYGGIMNINMFNDATSGVSRWKAAPNNAYALLNPDPATKKLETPAAFYNRVISFYRGNVNDATGGISETGYSKKWAGLRWLRNDEYKLWEDYFNAIACDNGLFVTDPKQQPYYPLNWAGIDCAAFVQRVVNVADPAINTTITDMPGVKTKVFELRPNDANYLRCNPPDDADNIINRAWVEYFFTEPLVNNVNLAEGRTYFVPLPEEDEDWVRKIKLLHKGDLIYFEASDDGPSHVAFMYSANTTCTDLNSSDSCSYQIIHASGGNKICYTQAGSLPNCTFNRKVVRNDINRRLTSDTLKTPDGFGRIKLWD